MTNILVAEGKLSPINSRTHITYTFEVPEGARAVRAKFSYSPKDLLDKEQSKKLIKEGLEKYVEPETLSYYEEKWETFTPLKNLITLSFDDPEQFRGACHRHDPVQEYVMSEDEGTPGLLKGPIVPGVWKVTISVHCVVTENCDYKLEIWEGDEVK